MEVVTRRAIGLTFVFLSICAPVLAQRPDFSGTWHLDRGASEITTGDGLAGLGDPAPENLYITQRGNGAVIISTRIRGAEARAYQMGGETWVAAPPPGDDRFLIRSRTRGLSMISEGTGEIDGEIVSVREVMTMDPRGDTLALEVTTTRSSGPATNKLIYRRVGGGGSR